MNLTLKNMKKAELILLVVTLLTSVTVKSQITSTNGLEDLKEIQGDLIISGTQISDLNGFVALNDVSGDVIIRNNSVLTDYCGLQNLLEKGTIGGEVLIEGNEIDLDVSNLDFSECTVGLGSNYLQVSNTYPNPVIDELHFSSNDKVKTISIFNAVGELVFFTEKVNNRIDISHLTKGYYTVKTNDTSNEVMVSKIVKN